MKAIAVGLVMSLILLYVWERVDLVRVGYRVQQLKGKHRLLQRENDELKVKVSALTSPERIARLAAERLGMVRPQAGQVVFVRLVPPSPFAPAVEGSELRLARHEVAW